MDIVTKAVDLRGSHVDLRAAMLCMVGQRNMETPVSCRLIFLCPQILKCDGELVERCLFSATQHSWSGVYCAVRCRTCPRHDPLRTRIVNTAYGNFQGEVQGAENR